MIVQWEDVCFSLDHNQFDRTIYKSRPGCNYFSEISVNCLTQPERKHRLRMRAELICLSRNAIMVTVGVCYGIFVMVQSCNFLQCAIYSFIFIEVVFIFFQEIYRDHS